MKVNNKSTVAYNVLLVAGKKKRRGGGNKGNVDVLKEEQYEITGTESRITHAVT